MDDKDIVIIIKAWLKNPKCFECGEPANYVANDGTFWCDPANHHSYDLIWMPLKK